MKPLLFACLICLPGPTRADALADLLAAKCGTMDTIAYNTNLLRDDIRQAYDTMIAVLMITTEALDLRLQLGDVCKANPGLTIEQAIRDALAATKK